MVLIHSLEPLCPHFRLSPAQCILDIQYVAGEYINLPHQVNFNMSSPHLLQCNTSGKHGRKVLVGHSQKVADVIFVYVYNLSEQP